MLEGVQAVDAKENTTTSDVTNDEVVTTTTEVVVDGEDPMKKVTSESEPEMNQDLEGTSIDETDADADADDGDDDGDDDDDGSTKEETTENNNDANNDGDKDDNDAESAADEIKDNRSQDEKDKEAKEKEEAENKRIQELKEKYKDWPLKDIKEPHEHDVMYGRGGGTNHHKGNKEYRKMVEDRKLEYVNSKRLDKPLVALEIIRIWRSKLPPGRFLKQNAKTGHWEDVGDKKAREKTSQALREKAPLIRKQQEDEQNGEEGAPEDESKTTRFAEGTKTGKKSSNKVKKAILARDHSLGREYLGSDEAISINDFTWQDPFKDAKRDTSMGSVTAPQHLPSTGPTANAASLDPHHGRNNSQGSVGMPPQFMHGGPNPNQQPALPPDYYGRVSSGEPRREYSNGSLGSWGAVSYPYPHQAQPPPPPPAGPHMHQRSGSWTHPLPPQSPQHGGHHQRSGSWGGGGGGGGGGGRMHSLSCNPLSGANVSRPADYQAFENSRSGSGYWGEQMLPPGAHGHPPPPPPPGAYGGYNMSGGSIGPPPQATYRQIPSPSHSTPSPPYNVMNIARTWSGGGGEVQRTWSGDHPPPHPMGNPQFDGRPRPVPGADTSPSRDSANNNNNNHIPRPTIVKRDTSNQNENYETKPQIKRAALNRDQSATSNRLKEECMPGYFDKEILSKEMQTLQEDTEQIRLSPGPDSYVQPLENAKPQPLSQDGRVSTMDAIMNDLMAKPSPLSGGDRVSTIDVLGGLVDEDYSDPFIDTKNTDDARGNYNDNQKQNTSSTSIQKPSALTQANRLTTQDLFRIADATDPLPM